MEDERIRRRRRVVQALAITGTPTPSLLILALLADGFYSWHEPVVLALCFAISFPTLLYYYTWRDRRWPDRYLRDR